MLDSAGYFYAWPDRAFGNVSTHALVMSAREDIDREAGPTRGAIDSLSVMTTGECQASCRAHYVTTVVYPAPPV